MSDQSSPITPPPELRDRWRMEAPPYRDGYIYREDWVMERAAQWGWDQRGANNEAQLQERADQELDACCEWVGDGKRENLCKVLALRKARRPKPPTLKELKERALAAAARFYAKGHEDCTEQEVRDDYDALCRALGALPE